MKPMSPDDWELPLHRFTAKQYYRMADVEILRPEDQVELLEGLVVDKSPITPAHAFAVGQLRNVLAFLSGFGYVIRYDSLSTGARWVYFRFPPLSRRDQREHYEHCGTAATDR
jgi:hypothetical protein